MRLPAHSVALVLLLLTVSSPLLGQQCQDARSLNQPQMATRFNEIYRSLLPDVAPLRAPEATKAGAPSSSRASTDIVDEPGFPTILGVAVESGLVSQESEAVTIDLNAFAWVAALDPNVVDRQSLYAQYETARRFGGSISISDSPASTTDDTSDAVEPSVDQDSPITYEVRWRFAGSRDRRDPQNFQKFIAATNAATTRFTQEENAFLRRHGADIVAMAGPDGCVDATRFDAFVATPSVRAELLRVATAFAALEPAVDAVLREIDGAPIWTLVAGGTERSGPNGKSNLKIALRGAWNTRAGNGTVNAEWKRAEEDADTPEPRWTIGYEHTLQMLSGSVVAPRGIEAALSGSVDIYDGDADVARDRVAKVGVKLEIPLTTTITLPISVVWASHRDLLSEESEVRGNVGLSMDLSKLRQMLFPNAP